MMLINLHNKAGELFKLNIGAVIAFLPGEILVTGGIKLDVQESVEEIETLINRVILAMNSRMGH